MAGLEQDDPGDHEHHADTIPGLLPEGRAARPTAANIFGAFAGLGFQRARTTNGLQAIPDPTTPAQQAILAALGIDSITATHGQA